MKELLNFIPRTVQECRALLIELRDNPEGVSIADRNGKIDVLNAEEIKALVKLVESQIGEKTPRKTTQKAQKNENKQER